MSIAESTTVQPPTQEARHLLHAGIAAVRAGQPAHARNLLMRAVAQNERDALAWLWLSEVLHSLSGRKACLERALALDPTNSEVSELLASVRKKLCDELLHKGIAAVHSGQHCRAYALLKQALEEDSKNPLAWLWLSKIAQTPQERIACRRKSIILKSGLKPRWEEPTPAQRPERAQVPPHPQSEAIKRTTQPPVAGRRRAANVLSGWLPLVFVLAGVPLLLVLSLMLARTATARAVPVSAAISAAHTNQMNLAKPISIEAQDKASPSASVLATATQPAQANADIQPTIIPSPPVPATTDTTASPPVAGIVPVYTPTRIVISAAGIDAPVVPSRLETEESDGIPQPRWTVPDPATVGWHLTSAPLGVPGNTVINGHNWPQDAAFRNLYKIQSGDQIVVFSDQLPFVFEVVEIVLLPEDGQSPEVQQANTHYVQPTDDERVTLVTCHPYGSVRYRLIIVALRTEAAQPDG